jgi:hypothetical protein
MNSFLKPSSLPKGWTHPKLRLHRAWYARRTWQWRARAVLVLTVPLLVAVIALNLSPYTLLLALLPAILPTPVRPASSLREVENLNGAYTTALTAPEDEFGFQRRLESQALSVQRHTELPNLPWLESAATIALCSLLLVFPPRAPITDPTARTVTREQLEREQTSGQQPSSNDAQPVLDAPSRGGAPAGSDAKPGQAASGGSLPESQVGDVKPGGGNASEDPEAISREFMEALERGAVRDRSESGDPQNRDGTRVQDNDATAGQQGSAGGDENADGSSGDQGGQNGRNNQQGNRPGQQGGSQNNPGQNGQQGNQGGQQGAQNGNSSDAQNPGGNNDSSGSGSQSNNSQNRNANGRGNNPELENDPSQGFNEGRDNQNATQRNQPGRGGRGSSDPTKPQGVDGQSGKLEYLPGSVKGTNVRSGALQLPGDPRRPLTGTPGTPGYKRAAESAILDPKLPPEYQELLKNYYR